MADIVKLPEIAAPAKVRADLAGLNKPQGVSP